MNREAMAKYALKQFAGPIQQSYNPQQDAELARLEQQQKKRWWNKAQPRDAILSPEERDILKRVKKRAILLDKGMNCCCCQIGLDGIIGLFPVVGDGLGFLLSLQVVHMAMAANIPSSLVSQMMFNIVFDFFIGIVPVVGDILDILYKANTKNALLLENYLIKRRLGQLNEPGNIALLPTHHPQPGPFRM